jgi:hypothetical protein
VEGDEVDRAFPDTLGSGTRALGGPLADVSCTAANVAARAAWQRLGRGQRLGGGLRCVGRLRRRLGLAVLAGSVLAAEDEG